jgi:phage-related protein
MPEIRFFRDRDGEVVREYFLAAVRAGDRASADALERTLILLSAEGTALRMPHARMIDRGERLFELRVRHHRVAFIEHQGEVVLLHAWRKRSQKLDTREASIAIARAARWREGRNA